MQTILGASGQIGSELALALKQDFSEDIRLVSRNPLKVNASDQLVSADLLDIDQTKKAVQGSEIVYFTAGLPLDTKRWNAQWPVMTRNVIEACAEHNAKLVYFDNTYMYPQTATPQTEETSFAPNGGKGRVRAAAAMNILDAIEQGRLEAMICRAPEFYGPGKTQSITNATVLNKLKAGKSASVFLRDDTLRTLIYTLDASRAMALLGNTPGAFNQTWHLPCDDNRLTYQQLIDVAADILNTECDYTILKAWQLKLVAIFNHQVRETLELLPRYAEDNIFESANFKARFPDFAVTPYRRGLEATLIAS